MFAASAENRDGPPLPGGCAGLMASEASGCCDCRAAGRMLAARPCAAAAATAGTAGGAGALLLGRVSDAQPVGPVRWRLGIFTATAALFLLACTAGHPCPYFMSSADPPHPVHLAEASGFCRLDGASRASAKNPQACSVIWIICDVQTVPALMNC